MRPKYCWRQHSHRTYVRSTTSTWYSIILFDLALYLRFSNGRHTHTHKHNKCTEKKNRDSLAGWLICGIFCLILSNFQDISRKIRRKTKQSVHKWNDLTNPMIINIIKVNYQFHCLFFLTLNMCTRWPAIPKELWECVTDYDRQWLLFNYSCAIIKWNKSIGFFLSIWSTTRKTNAITLWHFWMELNWSASCKQEESNHVCCFLAGCLVSVVFDCAEYWLRQYWISAIKSSVWDGYALQFT